MKPVFSNIVYVDLRCLLEVGSESDTGVMAFLKDIVAKPGVVLYLYGEGGYDDYKNLGHYQDEPALNSSTFIDTVQLVDKLQAFAHASSAVYARVEVYGCDNERPEKYFWYDAKNNFHVETVKESEKPFEFAEKNQYLSVGFYAEQNHVVVALPGRAQASALEYLMKVLDEHDIRKLLLVSDIDDTMLVRGLSKVYNATNLNPYVLHCVYTILDKVCQRYGWRLDDLSPIKESKKSGTFPYRYSDLFCKKQIKENKKSLKLYEAARHSSQPEIRAYADVLFNEIQKIKQNVLFCLLTSRVYHKAYEHTVHNACSMAAVYNALHFMLRFLAPKQEAWSEYFTEARKTGKTKLQHIADMLEEHHYCGEALGFCIVVFDDNPFETNLESKKNKEAIARLEAMGCNVIMVPVYHRGDIIQVAGSSVADFVAGIGEIEEKMGVDVASVEHLSTLDAPTPLRPKARCFSAFIQPDEKEDRHDGGYDKEVEGYFRPVTTR